MSDRRPQTYEIIRPEQLEALSSAKRGDIVDRLAAYGPLSVRELARHVGSRPNALYHHIEKLIAVGLVEEAGWQVRRRRREQLYQTPAPRMRLAKVHRGELAPALITQIVAAQSRQMARDFAAGQESSARIAEGELRNHTFFRLVGRPAPAQLARLNACVDEITEILWQSNAPGAPLVAISWVMTPIGGEDDPADREA